MENKDYCVSPNPDFIIRKQIEEDIKNNEGYCISTINHTEETKCICAEFRDQQATGWCKCKQYYKCLRTKKVHLCGNPEFNGAFIEAQKKFLLQDYSVTMPLLAPYNILTPNEIAELLEVQKAQIAETDLVYVINYDGLIDIYTKDLIAWATQLGKKIEYLEDNIDWQN